MYKSWAGSGWKPGGSCVSPVSLLLLCWNVLQTRPAVGLMWTELLTDPGRGDVRRRRCWQVEESLWSERRNKQPLQSGRWLEGNAVRDVCASLATAEPHSAAGSSANRQFPSQSQDRLSAQSQKLDLKPWLLPSVNKSYVTLYKIIVFRLFFSWRSGGMATSLLSDCNYIVAHHHQWANVWRTLGCLD